MGLWLVATWALILKSASCQEGLLYPRGSETREVVSLDGIWNFAVSPMNDPALAYRDKWFEKNLKQIQDINHYLMPVPSSYNDITQEWMIRDHVGEVWYERTFFVSKSWKNQRIWLRFSSVSYAAHVWINGELAMKHEVGHLPFQKEIGSFLKLGGNNKITVACSNVLKHDTIPQGSVSNVSSDNGKRLIQDITFDFFNYAGIDRPVTLYTTPQTYIDDISVNTDVKGTDGIVHYNVTIMKNDGVTCVAVLFDKVGEVVANDVGGGAGTIKVPSAHLWWPYLMDKDPAYLYTLQVKVKSKQGEVLDVYRQQIGIRTISWSDKTLLLNNRPVYFHGFGRHEDADIRGKGLDLALIVKDHNLIKWVGGNAYRTSHYPYADEIMDLTDQLGIMIINECPSVNTRFFTKALMKNHKRALTQLIQRDKNRPSVVMWSISNEPHFFKNHTKSDEYFRKIIKHVKNLDATRPVTMSINGRNNIMHDLDVVSYNFYEGWYGNTGRLDMITKSVTKDITSLHKKFGKPVLMSEYGADTVAGLHISPQAVWSEEYQVSLMSKHFQVFDTLRAEGWFIGEFIWNFADFMTTQKCGRVDGNKKGIFTRNRQPKASAHHLRKRYHYLALELYNITLPADLAEYISPIASKGHDEL